MLQEYSVVSFFNPYHFPALILWGMVLASLVAGLVRGFSGFGSAMVLFPLLSLSVGPIVAAPVTQALDSCLTVFFLRKAFRQCNWHEVWPLIVGAVAFVYGGVALLLVANGTWLRLGAAAAILATVIPMWFGWRYRRPLGKLAKLTVGALSGVMGGSTTLSGPPVILFWLSGRSDSETVRANAFVFFTLSEAVTLGVYAWESLYQWPVILLSISLASPFLIGLFSGWVVKKYASEKSFRRIALALIGLSAVIGLKYW